MEKNYLKKYRLIREYPGSPKLGTIASCSKGHGTIQFESSKGKLSYLASSADDFFENLVVNQPEFWQEVVEKDYEILKLALARSIKPEVRDFEGYSLDYINGLLACKDNYIHSVKRLSDFEVFTIGDKCKDINTNCITTVSEITLKDTICFINGVNINYLKKVKQPLFTTEDGVDVYPEGRISTVLSNTMELYTIDGLAGKNTTPVKGFKYFSTKEAAEEYILMNKSCLSVQDVLDNYSLSSTATFDNLKQLVKERL